MPSFDTQYYGLLRTPTTLGIGTETATFPAYIEVIRSAEALPSTYYYLSLERDSRFNSADYPTEFFSEIETDLGITLVEGDVFIARPLDEGLTKQERQVMKLEIAAKKRTRDGNARDTYDITQLPDTYNDNDPGADDNANTGGLVEGRPWITTVTPGLVVSLDAGNVASYPGSGSTWTNLVDNTAYTITDGTYNSGNGGYIVYNGTSTVVPIGNPIPNGSNYTKEAWVYFTNLGSSRSIISSYSNLFYAGGSSVRQTIGGVLTTASITTLSLNVWTHLVVTFDDTNNTATMYKDGVQTGQQTNVTQSYGIVQTEVVGGSTSIDGTIFSARLAGRMAIARVYTNALTAAEVLANFNSEKARFGL